MLKFHYNFYNALDILVAKYLPQKVNASLLPVVQSLAYVTSYFPIVAFLPFILLDNN